MRVTGPIAARVRFVRRGADQAVALLVCDYSRFLGVRVSEELAGQIRATQLSDITRYSVAVTLANMFNAAILVASFWTTPSRLLALGWAIGLAGCMLSRNVGWRRRGVRPAARRSVSMRTMHRLVRNAALLGCLWGAAPALFFSGASEGSRVVIICLCAGTLGAGAFVLASVPAAALAMMAPLAAGSLAALLQIGGVNALLTIALTLVYCATLISGLFPRAREQMSRLVSKLDIERLARRDSVTDLHNNAALREAIDVAQARLRRSGEPSSLFCVDIDRLRDINARFGHAAGDDLLRQAGERLKRAIREVDAPARLNGGQFAVLATGLGGDATAHAIARRLQAAFSEPFTVGGAQCLVSVSIGAAVAREGAAGADDLLRRASLALFLAKRKDGDRLHIHDASDDASRYAHDALEADLRAALAHGGLRLAFQPVLHIERDEICGFEALLRWRHPVRGVISPQDIVAVAEERGLIDALGVWVLREACRVAAAWPPSLRVSVNVSPLQLRSNALVQQVAGALRDAGLPPQRLELEVTESALIDDHPLARHVLTSLRDAGVKLALDDFGVAYSSLNYLRRFPFDRLKIDRSFVADALRDARAAAIVRAVLRLAGELDLAVTAEGVETAAQLAFLRDNHCAAAQGYLIGRPMAEAQALAFLEARARHAAA